MNIKHFLDEILDKWPAKVICLIVAIFLYFFHQASIIDSKTVVVPLQIIEDGIVMHVGAAQKLIPVVIRASSEDIKLIDTSEIKAYISLNNISEKGQYSVPVQLDLSVQLLDLDPFEVKLKEENILVYVDRKAFKYVPILPSIVGEVAHGYEIQEISMNPSTVEISGPESVINSTLNIYSTRVNVSNAETNFTVETDCQNQSDIITIGDQGPFKATVTVVPVVMEREFEAVPVEFINLAENLEVNKDDYSVYLKLSGNMNVLENYILSKQAVQINMRDITEPGNYTLPLKFVIPANLQLVEKSDEELNILVVGRPMEEPQENSEAGN